MTDDDDDLPEIEPLAGRKEYVIHEVEFLAGWEWPERIAEQLGYTDADSLQASLYKWGRPDLAVHFERWRYDGNVPQKIVQQILHRKAKAKEAA